jgi:hypothetical protein
LKPVADIEWSEDIEKQATEYTAENNQLPPGFRGVQQAKRLTKPGNQSIHPINIFSLDLEKADV